MTALGRITVGVVVERRSAASQWIDFVWQPVSVLPGHAEAEPWTVLAEEAGRTTFFAGTTTIELHASETTNYRDNLASGRPSVWIALRPTEADPPYRLFAATVDPAEGEAFTEAGVDLIEAVPMPNLIIEAVTAFVAEHHVERPFFKRKRDRANADAMSRRTPGREEGRK
jgi:Protein of unknown function (DUF3305)